MTTKNIITKKPITKAVSEDLTNQLLLDRISKLERLLEKSTTTVTDKEAYTENVKTSTKQSPLMPGKVIEIIPIKRGATNFIDDSDQATMLDGVSKSIVTPMSSKLKRLIDPLTTSEKEYLEEVLGLNLNIHSRNSNAIHDSFYVSYDARILFKKKSRSVESAARKFNLGDPLEFLLYKICLSSPRVAKDWKDRDNRRYEFVVKDSNAELNEELAHTHKEDIVIRHLFDIQHNKKALYDLFRLYGSSRKKISLENSSEFIYNELRKLSKSIAGIRKLYKVVKLNIDNPGKLEKMILIEDAIVTGFLTRKGNEFKLPGGDVVGFGVDEVIIYLDSPENSSIKMRLIATVNNYYKNKK